MVGVDVLGAIRYTVLDKTTPTVTYCDRVDLTACQIRAALHIATKTVSEVRTRQEQRIACTKSGLVYSRYSYGEQERRSAHLNYLRMH